MFRSQRAAGFTLIETLVAVSLLLLVLLLPLSLLWQQPRVVQRLEAQRAALQALEALLETVRIGGLPLVTGAVEWELPPPAGIEEYRLFLEVAETDVDGLYDLTLQARYELQHRGFTESLRTRIWRP